MKVVGRSFREHLQLLVPLFGLTTTVWVIRLILSSAKAPHAITAVFSVGVAGVASTLLAVLLIHVRRFGSYPNVVVASFLINSWAQLLIIAAIAFSVLTGYENIFTAPEYSIPTDDIHHLRHIYGHLTFGIGVNTLFGSGVGCLLLWLMRKLAPLQSKGSGSAVG